MYEFAEYLRNDEHPTLKRWQKFRSQYSEDQISLRFVRERNGLMFLSAEFELTVAQAGRVIHDEAEDWDIDFNLALIDAHFRVVDETNESERFGMMLKSFFKPIEERFSDGYFNAALLSYLQDTPFERNPRVRETLAGIPPRNRPSADVYWSDFSERVTVICSRCATLLSDRLHYSPKESETILGNGIAYYLDERFSVTNRRLLGWATPSRK